MTPLHSSHNRNLASRIMSILYRLKLRNFHIGDDATWGQYTRWLDNIDTWSNL